MGVCSHTFTYHAPPCATLNPRPHLRRPARYELLSRVLPSPLLLPPPPRALVPLGAPASPRRVLLQPSDTPCSVSAGRFFAVGTISLCQTGAGLICEAFAGTSRPRIIIKIPHTDAPASPVVLPLVLLLVLLLFLAPRPAAAATIPPPAPCSAAPTFRDITFHSELDQSFNGRKFNLCAALQNNRELRRRASERAAWKRDPSRSLLFIRSYY